MTLSQAEGWVDWTEGYRYEPIEEGQGRCLPCSRMSEQRLRKGGVASFFIAAACAIGLWASNKTPAVPPVTSPLPRSTKLFSSRVGSDKAGGTWIDEKPMKVGVTNSYSFASGVPSTSTLYPWEHVAEPYRKTVLEIVSWPQSTADSISFRWEVEGKEIGKGAAITAIFESPGAYNCTVTSFRRGLDSLTSIPSRGSPKMTPEIVRSAAGLDNDRDDAADDFTPKSLRFRVIVKYVRREIRQLTDHDREIFFNAVSIMQRVPSAVGRQVYGKKYYSKDYFNRMHLYYGGRRDCDHWHDGTGFVTSHVALSLMFEQSLQAVNPSIALPYWDFTIEGTFSDWTDFRQSSVFSDDWFGEAAPQNSLHTPDRGRFGYVPAMTKADEYSDVYNSFGVLRSPWNSDPSPFLTRSDQLLGHVNNRKPSGCKQYRDSIMKDTWMSLAMSMNDDAHGHIHELLGGMWSQAADGYAQHTTEIIQPFLHMVVPYLKMLWRAGYLTCPDLCTKGQSWEECRCGCPTVNLHHLSPSEVLEDAGTANAGFFYDSNMTLIPSLVDENGHVYESIPGYTEAETEDIYREMLAALCTPMKIGSHYEGTSTNDITFWVLHTTFDRLWHLSRLEDDASFDETWVDSSSCYGHNSKDIQPFHNLFLSDFLEDAGSSKSERSLEHVNVAKFYYTNQDLYDLLRPDALQSPYIYDNFDWTHCEEEGVFVGKLEHQV